MSRLIIASNRVTDPNAGQQAGGLAVALRDALSDRRGIWFGWSGTVVEDGDADRAGLQIGRSGGITLATVPLSESEREGYYLGYSNRALWPVFHYRLDLAEFDGEDLACYKAVNRRFARALAPLVEPDDLIWIHDYHLLPLAAELRQLGVQNRIGFFLHIPFPPPEMVAAVPEHEWLFDALFACDLIGFQTEQDRGNFLNYVRQTGADVSAETHPFRAAGREPKVGFYPIGIDVEAFRATAHTPEADERIRRLARAEVADHIIGVDRLDYSKGLPDRLRAFERFLERWPELRKKTVLMQIAPPTRGELTAYADIRAELEQLSGAINGRYGDFDWTPVRYVHKSLPRDTLAALFRGSSVGLVTPLRDGMNLVALEYVAAQDEDAPGVLILSQFAGAAAFLDQALIVNPYDRDEVADALHKAISMTRAERRERHHALLERVRALDVAHWRRHYLADLDALGADAAAPS